MLCPHCRSESSRVVDTRPARSGNAVRRRRECADCRERFTTYESVERRPLQVLKRGGAAERFERDKLWKSIATACAKRPVAPSEIAALVNRIEDALSSTAGVEISSEAIGQAVMEGLEPLDRVAYVRYASVYRNFQRLDEFQEAVHELIARERREERDRLQRRLVLDGGGGAPGDVGGAAPEADA